MLKDPAFPFGKKELFDMLALQITDIYEKYYPEANRGQDGQTGIVG